MARMIPSIDPETIENAGEKEMYRRLRDQLPDFWVVRYHFPACWLDGLQLRECECDFIVLAPSKGLLLVEVKGSHGYHSENGQWFRVKADGTRELTRNPFDQATSTKHKLVERITNKVFRKPKHEFPGRFGHVVAYPFGRVLGKLPASAEPALLFSYADMPKLHEKIESALTAWGSAERGAQFTLTAMGAVERFLAEDSDLVPVLAAKVDEDERRIEDLTRRQFTAFRGILGHLRVHVRGTAGSGKTNLALWAAEALAAKGKKVLLLCFNRVLAAWLKQKQSSAGTVDIRSFFALCRETVNSTGTSFIVPNGEGEQREFWSATAPRLFCEALESHPELTGGYDAVLVDESQDFHADWWFPVQLLLRDPDHGRLTIFSDPEQAGVYGRGDAYPAGLLSFDLFENCRNTKRITSFCGKVIDQEITSFSSSPEGTPPEVYHAMSDASHRGTAVQDLVGKLLDEGFSPSRIAILSPWRSTTPTSALAKLFSVRGTPIHGDESSLARWTAGNVIWSSTIKAFKGLEADCVIMADAPSPTTTVGFSISDFYVAASRCKHRLYIFPVSVEAKSEIDAWCATGMPPS